MEQSLIESEEVDEVAEADDYADHVLALLWPSPLPHEFLRDGFSFQNCVLLMHVVALALLVVDVSTIQSCFTLRLCWRSKGLLHSAIRTALEADQELCWRARGHGNVKRSAAGLLEADRAACAAGHGKGSPIAVGRRAHRRRLLSIWWHLNRVALQMLRKFSLRVQRNYVVEESSRWANERSPTSSTKPKKGGGSTKSPQTAPSHYEELQKRRQMQKGTLAITEEPVDGSKVKTPPTLLVGSKESPTAPEPVEVVEVSRPRPSLVDGLRRKTMKFRQWMGRLVSAKSYGPGVLEFEGVSDDEDAASSPNEKPKEGTKNHFLAAYLTGDLEVLDYCLQANAGKHGQRSFIAIAQEHGEISLDEWLRMFHAASMKKKLKELSGTSYEEVTRRAPFCAELLLG
eukprot:s1577_g6.t1